MKLGHRVIRALAVSGLILLIAASSSFGKVTLKGLVKRGNAIKSQKHQVIQKLREVKKQQKSAAVRLHTSEVRLRTTQVTLSDVRSQLSNTRNRLTRTRSELSVVNKRLQATRRVLASRLVSNYKHGNVGYLNVLLDSSDFSDMLNRGYILEKIARKDLVLISEFKEDKRAVEVKKSELEHQEHLRAELEDQQSALTAQASAETVERRQTLAEISKTRAEYEQMLDELERNSRQIESLIRRMESTPQGRKRLATVWHGSLSLPVNGRVTSPFGRRFHPIVHQWRVHTGVDLAVPYGTPIHAAGAGVVIFAGYNGADGETIIIDHTGGIQTVYGHQSHFAVGVGQSVNRGQVIGYVGMTGWTTGPHCHFEVRRRGVPVNPFGMAR